MTFGEMLTSITNWSREFSEPGIATDALNDAIERLARKLLLVRLSDLFNGPVSVELAQDSNTIDIVLVPDPQVAPTVTPTASSAAPPAARTVICCYTWVTATGAETLPSPTTTLTLTGQFMNWAAPALPPSANANQVYGWVPYAQDPVTGDWYIVSDLPVPLGQGFLETLEPPAFSPLPTSNTTSDTLFYIKHMELVLPNGETRSWNQDDLDGDTMRRLASSVPATSPYVRYAFDVVNNNQLLIRPTAGCALNPLIYYVNCPGRIAFPNVQLPFGHIPSSQPFLRYESLALFFMAVDENDRADGWQQKADKTLQELIESQTRTRARSGLMVTPYAGMR